MICLQNMNVYVSLKDGNMKHVFIRIDSNYVHIEQLGFEFKSEGVSYSGCVTSPHGTLLAILES